MSPLRILPPSHWNELGGGFSHTPPAETKSYHGNHSPGPCRSKLTMESPRHQGQSHLHIHQDADGFPSFSIQTQKLSFSKMFPPSEAPAASSEGDPSSSNQFPPPPSHSLVRLHEPSPRMETEAGSLIAGHLGPCAIFPGGQGLLPGCLGSLHIMQEVGAQGNVCAGCVDMK